MFFLLLSFVFSFSGEFWGECFPLHFLRFVFTLPELFVSSCYVFLFKPKLLNFKYLKCLRLGFIFTTQGVFGLNKACHVVQTVKIEGWFCKKRNEYLRPQMAAFIRSFNWLRFLLRNTNSIRCIVSFFEKIQKGC